MADYALPVEVWTDGSCTNDGRGGWGVVIVLGRQALVASGVVGGKTNSCAAEVHAILNALRLITYRAMIMLYTDSAYAIRGIEKVQDGLPGHESNADLWEIFRGLYRWQVVLRAVHAASMAPPGELAPLHRLADKLAGMCSSGQSEGGIEHMTLEEAETLGAYGHKTKTKRRQASKNH